MFQERATTISVFTIVDQEGKTKVIAKEFTDYELVDDSETEYVRAYTA